MSMMNSNSGCRTSAPRFTHAIREWQTRFRQAGERALHVMTFDRLVTDDYAPRTLLPQMLGRHGIDRAAVADRFPGVWYVLQRTCTNCPFKGACRKALARGASAEECGRFCVNDATLVALRREPFRCSPDDPDPGRH